jgi:phage tail-like protein
MSTSPILANKHSFHVTIEGVTDEDEYFYAVEGLSIHYSIDPYSPGGGLYSVYMPHKIESRPLILKRPVINKKSGLIKWCTDALEKGCFKPVDVNIFIMNIEGDINNQWLAEKAIPIGFEISSMDMNDKSDVNLMEVITLVYQSLKRVK